MRARTFSKALQRKRESWASSAALPWTAACTEGATGNAFRCYFFSSVGLRADAGRERGAVRALSRACVRVRAWCVRAGVPGLQPNIAAARSPYGNTNASGICSAGRGVARPPYLTEKSPQPTYLVSSYCFRSGARGTGKKGFKKDTSGHTTVRAAHPPPFACSPTWFALWVLGNRFWRVPRVAFKKDKSMVAWEGGENNEHRKWKRIVGVNK